MAKKSAANNKTASKATNKKPTADSDDKQAKGKNNGLKPATAVNVRHILCEKHSKATEALEQLQGGQSFDKVAQTYSEDKAKVGGALGWMSRGTMVGAFQDAAFALEPSSVGKPTISSLVKTQFGYHIIMVEGRR